jgi:hypothetical protein
MESPCMHACLRRRSKILASAESLSRSWTLTKDNALRSFMIVLLNLVLLNLFPPAMVLL